MGLPIWVEPSEHKSKNTCCAAPSAVAASKPSDLTPHHRAARSAIRRQSSVRYPNNTRPRSLHPVSHAYLRGSLRSPPPAPPSHDVPPVPSLPSQRHGSAQRRPNDEDLRPAPDVIYIPPRSPEHASASRDHERNAVGLPRGNPFFSEVSQSWRPRSRRGTITYERETASPTAIDPDLPLLRRMGRRSINDRQRSRSRSPNRRRPSFRVPRDYFHDDFEDDHLHAHGPGLGDRDRSVSPDAEQWETLLTTITPDPSLPSAESSFNSAAASFPGPLAHGSRHHPPRSPRLRPLGRTEAPLSPLSQPMHHSNSRAATFEDEICLSDSSTDPSPHQSQPAQHESTRQTYSRYTPFRHNDPSTPLQELYSAIDGLSSRTNRVIRSFSSLADSFRSTSPTLREVAALRRQSHSNGTTPRELGDMSTSLQTPRSDEEAASDANEIRALVADVNALHDNLERTVRASAEARARRVSGGADPLRSIRRNASSRGGAYGSFAPTVTSDPMGLSMARTAREERDPMPRSREARALLEDPRTTLAASQGILQQVNRMIESRETSPQNRRLLQDARAQLEGLWRSFREATGQ